MTWKPRYVLGKLAIVPDQAEGFAHAAIESRIREIESGISEMLAQAKAGSEIDTDRMLQIFGSIWGLFGCVSFTVGRGPPNPDLVARLNAALAIDAKWDELRALDAKLNDELDAAA